MIGGKQEAAGNTYRTENAEKNNQNMVDCADASREDILSKILKNI